MKLDIVSEHVKSCMLTFPGLFPDRISVLSHIFIESGNGCEWDSNGVIYDMFETEYRDTMNYDDIERDAHSLTSSDTELKELLPFYFRDREIQLKRKRLMRQLIEQDIDFHAKHYVFNTDRDIRFQDVDYFTILGPYSLIAKVPDNVHPDWRQAALETVEFALRVLIRSKDPSLSMLITRYNELLTKIGQL